MNKQEETNGHFCVLPESKVMTQFQGGKISKSLVPFKERKGEGRGGEEEK